MHLTRLALNDFRSYVAVDVVLGAGVNTMVGANGQGKTNLVEAVGYLATLGSHRVASDAPLVRRGADRAVVRGMVVSHRHDTLVEIEVNPGRANRVRVNRAPLTRPREVLGILRTVLFAPEDLGLVKGDPDQRRRFLDDLLVSTAPRYAAVRSDYERVLRQRTALLKQLRARAGHGSRTGSGGARPRRTARSGGDPGEEHDTSAGSPQRMLAVWDEHMATLGAELLEGRISLTATLRPLVGRAYEEVAGSGSAMTVDYRASAGTTGGLAPGDGPPERAKIALALHEALARVRAEEIERGVCLVGPHRDDLELRIGELPARGYASQGESWSAALALRLASYELLRADGDEPVLLLDDVFAELDSGRRDRLAGLVARAEQVLVTAAVAGDVPSVLAGARFRVSDGTVSREE
ncbi:MAG TPA: DNA replication/repair protein RecF [Streptosporangiaceae bacterium]|nr:DNA replication/repair protein RecF [Streptosporangiaceae bacterium]